MQNASQVRTYIAVFLFAIVFTLVCRYFFIQPYIIPDESMGPLFRKGDVLLVNRLAHRKSFERNETIIFRNSNAVDVKHIRKIVGLPNEYTIVNDGILSIKTEEDQIVYELPLFGSTVSTIHDIGRLDAHEYFVLPNILLEPPVGMIDERFIIGTPIARIWPLASIEYFSNK